VRRASAQGDRDVRDALAALGDAARERMAACEQVAQDVGLLD